MVANKGKGQVSVRDFSRSKAPALPYQKIAQKVLPSWDISLVFVGETRAKKLNQQLRNKDYVPNVLSYVTDDGKHTKEKSGEIIICLAVAKRQAPSYDLSYRKFVAYLFIHGLLHLEGQRHGSTMELQEKRLLSQLLL